MHLTQTLLLCAGGLLAATALAPAADNTRGAVELSDGVVLSQNPSLPKLHLNDDQREQIRQALLTKDTEIEFKLSTPNLLRILRRKLALCCRQSSSRMAFRRS